MFNVSHAHPPLRRSRPAGDLSRETNSAFLASMDRRRVRPGRPTERGKNEKQAKRGIDCFYLAASVLTYTCTYNHVNDRGDPPCVSAAREFVPVIFGRATAMKQSARALARSRIRRAPVTADYRVYRGERARGVRGGISSEYCGPIVSIRLRQNGRSDAIVI